jgi:hypothetical protein
MRQPFALLAIALLCFLAYAPSLSLPLFEDDYGNLIQAQVYGPAAGLPQLMHDAVFRLRATSYWTMWPLWQLFHTTAWPYHLFSLLLHALNVWLVYGLAAAWPRMRPAALWTAAFFAVAEGHQEAVMWFSAINELYLFLFGASSLLCWMLAWRPGGSRWLLAASPLLFALALLSKESAVVFLPLFLLAAPAAGWTGLRRSIVRLGPHIGLAALAVTSIVASHGVSFRFSDGSFSLHAPFWMAWPRGMARILWIWGWLALAAIAWFRKHELRKSAYLALAWMGIALAPYSFLTYSAQIPSRQTYLASFGLALLTGLALAHLAGIGPSGRRAAAAAALIMLLSNAGYVWTRKRAQFLARAEPTEQLIKLARQTEGPIWVQCFPRVPYIAQEAVQMAAGRPPSTLIWTPAEAERRKPAAVFCYHER